MPDEIKAIFFDLDGTLVDIRTGEVPASAQLALRTLRKKGVKLFIASGRPPFLADLIQEIFDFSFDGKVLLNGQYCVDEDGIPFYKNPLGREPLEGIIRWLKDSPEICCTFVEEDRAYANRPGTRRNWPVEDVSRCLEHATYQVSPLVGPEMDTGIMARVKGIKSARWNRISTDLIPADGGKTVGMRKMLERFGLSREACMAFGDGANDTEMLRYAGVGVAMGNGDDAAKRAADFITDAAGADGIVNALRHFGLL